MQHKGREKAAKVVEFVAKWLNLCPSTVRFHVRLTYINILSHIAREVHNTHWVYQNSMLMS